jgi:hypothetical protein
VCEAGAIVIARRREEDLGFVFEPAERLGVNDAVAVTLKRRPDVVLLFWPQPPFAVTTFRRCRRQNLPLALLEVFANPHDEIITQIEAPHIESGPQITQITQIRPILPMPPAKFCSLCSRCRRCVTRIEIHGSAGSFDKSHETIWAISG